YSYDNEGNLIQKVRIADGQAWTFGYDHRNLMVFVEQRTATGALIQRVDFTYDVFGRRIQKDVTAGGATVVTRFAYDGGNVWADLDSASRLQMRRLYLDAADQVFARIDAGGTAAWYLTDRQGSVRDLVNASGVVQDHLEYDGFGNVVRETNP